MRSIVWVRIVGLLGLVLLTGCINNSTLQTARVVPRGDERMVVGGGKMLTSDVGVTLPYAEVMYRYGLWENLDVGAHLTLLGTGAIDVKYQFLADDHLAVAAGLKGGTLELTTEGPDPDDPSKTVETKTGLAQLIVPVYVSYDIGTHLSLYASPQYMLNAVVGVDSTAFQHFAGSTLGVKLGDGWGLMFEATAMYGFTTSNLLLQGNAAIFWSPRWL